MSRRYREQLTTGSGFSTQAVESKLGASLLKKLGWSEGEGLGEDASGAVEPLQIKRRAEDTGLGAETKKAKDWNEWWTDIYNRQVVELAPMPASGSASSSSSSSSSESDSDSDAEVSSGAPKSVFAMTGQELLALCRR